MSVRPRRLLAALAGLLWIAACTASDSTDPNRLKRVLVTPTPAGADIVDGSHGGTAGFYFLPPISKRLKSYPGSFDSDLAPTVEICAWTGTACGDVVARMTVSGTPDGRIFSSSGRQRYSTKWRLHHAHLAPSTLYRIQVELDGQVLGYADAKTGDDDDKDGDRHGDDLQSFAGAQDQDNDDDDTEAPHADHGRDYVLLKEMDHLWIRFRLEHSLRVAGTIGAAGGTVTSRDGIVTVTFPPGALSEPTDITITRKGWPSTTTVPYAWDIGPTGLQFGLAATIAVAGDPALLTAADPAAVPLIVTHPGSTDPTWTLLAGATHDPITGRSSAKIWHFTTYAYLYVLPSYIKCARVIAGNVGPLSTLGCDPAPTIGYRDTVSVSKGGSAASTLLADVDAPFPMPMAHPAFSWSVTGVFPSCENTFADEQTPCMPELTVKPDHANIATRNTTTGVVSGISAGDAILSAVVGPAQALAGQALARVRTVIPAATHLFSFAFNSNAELGGSRGTLFGGASIVGGQLALNGTTAFAQLDSRIVGDTGSFTVTFFATESAATPTYVEFLSQGISGTGFYVGHTPAGNIRVADTWFDTGIPMPADNLEHAYVVTFDATSNVITLYVDGQLKGSRMALITRGTVGGKNTRFGRQFDPFAEFLRGAVDNVGVYPTVLPPADIEALSRRGSDLTCASEGAVRSGSGNTTTIVFENQSGEVIYVYWLDFSGNRVLYAILPRGGAYAQQTFITHPWLIQGATSGKCYGIWHPVSTGRTVEAR